MVINHGSNETCRLCTVRETNAELLLPARVQSRDRLAETSRKHNELLSRNNSKQASVMREIILSALQGLPEFIVGRPRHSRPLHVVRSLFRLISTQLVLLELAKMVRISVLGDGKFW